MIPALKNCYVLLNRDFLDVKGTTGKINYFPNVEIENCEKSYRSKISDRKTSFNITKENSSKVRNKKQINYSDDIKNTDGENSDSEFSYDSSSSDDDDSAQEQKSKVKHDLSKTNPKELSCLLCNKSFSRHVSYLTHKRSHKSKPFKCILCGKGFENRQSFLNHMKKLHPEVDPFVCEYPRCEENFKTQKRLENHCRMHKKYMCKYCKKLFVRKRDMKKHVLKIH